MIAATMDLAMGGTGGGIGRGTGGGIGLASCFFFAANPTKNASENSTQRFNNDVSQPSANFSIQPDGAVITTDASGK